MKRILMITVFVLVMTVPALAVADCYIDGKRVPEGTRLGPLVCVGSEWVYRP